MCNYNNIAWEGSYPVQSYACCTKTIVHLFFNINFLQAVVMLHFYTTARGREKEKERERDSYRGWGEIHVETPLNPEFHVETPDLRKTRTETTRPHASTYLSTDTSCLRLDSTRHQPNLPSVWQPSSWEKRCWKCARSSVFCTHASQLEPNYNHRSARESNVEARESAL